MSTASCTAHVRSPRPPARRWSKRRFAALLVFPAAIFAGCAAPRHDSLAATAVRIEAHQYHDAFTAAEEVLRSHGYVPAFRDRRAGMLETGPERIPTIGEFWVRDGSTLSDRMNASTQHLRRRLRFEFVPTSTGAEVHDTDVHDLPGPDLMAFLDPPADLTAWTGSVELRVWAWIERPHLYGLRRHPWSLTLTRRSREGGLLDQPVTPDDRGRRGSAAFRPGGALEILGRDPAYERTLVHEVARTLRAAHDPD